MEIGIDSIMLSLNYYICFSWRENNVYVTLLLPMGMAFVIVKVQKHVAEGLTPYEVSV